MARPPTRKKHYKTVAAKELADVRKGNTLTTKCGIYSSAVMDAEEESLWDNLSLEKLDDEIKVWRLRLRRCVGAEAAQTLLLRDPKTEDKAMTINKVVRGLTPEGAIFSRERIVKDYGRDADTILNGLLRLIQVRQQILVGTFEEQDGKMRAEAMQQAASMMDKMFTLEK
jgi:hypothetical protein